jgi:hypothetical protein
MDADARVCPFCGEAPGEGVFCAACGRNLGEVEQLPTRAEWERGRENGGAPEPPEPGPGVGIEAFLAAMHAAGDPGVAKLPRTEPGFLGRKQHVQGWIVRDAGVFVTVDGRLHRLERSTQGINYIRGPAYIELVGREADEDVATHLAALLREHGLA